jgi:hypothetical protein
MTLTHIIDGKEVNGRTFEVPIPYGEGTHRLAQLNEDALIMLHGRLENPTVPDLDQRLRMVQTLSEYQPSTDLLKQIALMRGTPISVLQREAEEARFMVNRIANSINPLEYQGTGQTSTVAIPHNNIGEALYFLSWLMVAGSPSIIKPSSQEPLLARDVFNYLSERDSLPPFIDLVYADTSNPQESFRFRDLMRLVDVPIVMGEKGIVGHQLTFDAERSRAIILPGTDMRMLEENLLYSIVERDSCLAEKNLFVVGDETYTKVIGLLGQIYRKIKRGDLHDPRTSLGITPDDVARETKEILAQGESFGALDIVYPTLDGNLTEEHIRDGVVYTYTGVDEGDLPHFALWGQMPPAYITGVHRVNSMSDALRLFGSTQEAMRLERMDKKVMAMSVYSPTPSSLLGKLKRYAHDVHTQTPARTVGVFHQGIELGKELRNGGH